MTILRIGPIRILLGETAPSLGDVADDAQLAHNGASELVNSLKDPVSPLQALRVLAGEMHTQTAKVLTDIKEGMDQGGLWP